MSRPTQRDDERTIKNCCPDVQEMVDYMDAHGLAYDKTGGDYNHSSDEWDVAILTRL